MISNLQVLRALAALNVVFFHIIITSFSYGQGVKFLSFLGDWGANGVDIFFVLSGFIMVYIQDKRHRTAPSFLFNRIIRITPIYWFLTIVFLVFYLILPSAFRELTLDAGHVLSSFMFSSEFLGYGQPVLYVGWTLEYEMLFYVLFSIGIIFNNKILSFLIPIILLLLLSLLGITGLIVLNFVFGMFCAKLYFSKKYNHFGFFSIIIGTMAIVISIFYKVDLEYRFIFYGIPAFLIIFGLINVKQTKNKLLVYLGDASYSIYLVQVFTIPLFYKISSKLLNSLQSDIVSILALVFTTVVGCITYSLIERKMSSFLNDRIRRKTASKVKI